MPNLSKAKEELFYHYIPGDGDKAIVLLHSLGTDHQIWQYQMEALSSEGYTIVAPDARGHGKSSYQTGISLDLWVDDILNLIDHLHLDKVVLCGVSMGGVEAMAFALKHPQRVSALILADTFAGLDLNEVPNKIKLTAGAAEERGMALYADIYLDSTLSQSPYASKMRESLRRSIAGMDVEAYKGSAESCFRIQLENQLGMISVPTLVLIGEEDLKTPIELSQLIANKIPNAELHVVPNGRHLSNVDEPVAFNLLLMDFLKQMV